MDDFNILSNANVGFEFEFFSNYEIEETMKMLSTTLNKQILYFDKHHSEFSPTADIFKIEKDYSGGAKMIELITGPIKYIEAKNILKTTLEWIHKNGFTTDKCSIHLNMSFDKKLISIYKFTRIDVLKFILEFDENIVYNLFPKRKDSVYAKSIKFIYPRNKFYASEIKNISNQDFIYPTTKYYGINFSKLLKNYLELRYIGGADYENYFDEIVTILDYFIKTVYNTINNSDYTQANKDELYKILINQKKLINSYKSYSNFKKEYPKLRLTCDLKEADSYIDSFYTTNLRDKIFDILSETSLAEGLINYNSDNNTIELKYCIIDICYNISKVKMFDTKINGNISNCHMFDCTAINSNISETNIFKSEISKSKLGNCYINDKCVINDSYIFGKNTIICGEVNKGIIREGFIEEKAKVSKETEIVEYIFKRPNIRRIQLIQYDFIN